MHRVPRRALDVDEAAAQDVGPREDSVREAAYGPMWGVIACSVLGGVNIALGAFILASLWVFAAAVCVKLTLDAVVQYAFHESTRRSAGMALHQRPAPGGPEEFGGIVGGPPDLKAGDVLEGRPVLKVPTDWMLIADDLKNALVAIKVEHAPKCRADDCNACQVVRTAYEAYDSRRRERVGLLSREGNPLTESELEELDRKLEERKREEK